MSTTLERPTAEATSSPLEVPYLFNVEDFYRMVDLDFFPDEARVGLWEGRVYREMSKNHPHSFSWSRLNAALFPLLPREWSLWAECSLTISEDKAPLPDMLILRGDLEVYRERRPEAADVGLLIEVADSSLKIDTGAKLQAYALAGIPTYWVLNLKDGVIHVYSEPVPAEERYASMTTVGLDGSIPFVLDGNPIAMVPVATIL